MALLIAVITAASAATQPSTGPACEVVASLGCYVDSAAVRVLPSGMKAPAQPASLETCASLVAAQVGSAAMPDIVSAGCYYLRRQHLFCQLSAKALQILCTIRAKEYGSTSKGTSGVRAPRSEPRSLGTRARAPRSTSLHSAQRAVDCRIPLALSSRERDRACWAKAVAHHRAREPAGLLLH